MPGNTLFLTLRVFSATGGIEKVSRVAGKALYELANETPGCALKIFSMYDAQADADEKYFPAANFTGFFKNKRSFVNASIRQGVGCKQVILSHSNLLLPGYLIKLLSPRTKLILLAHGIEVWKPFTWLRKYMLHKCDHILAVSNFTKATIMAVHRIAENKVTVLNNCLDPFLPLGGGLAYNGSLAARYGIVAGDMVLLTITRLSFKEQYKGYDNVLYAIKNLKQAYPKIKYLLAGKYDAVEKQRVDAISAELGIQHNIIFTGFIADEDLAALYHIADIYIMPSKKEGFGIVFIEAMYYGKPVIAGNKDGSADALDNGNFGLLINPDDQQEISDAIVKVISNKTAYIPNLQDVMDKFSYPVYKNKLRTILAACANK